MSGRPSRRWRGVACALALGLGTLGLAGCEDLLQEPDSGKLPALLEIVSGDGQAGGAGRALGEPLRVRVRDVEGNPVSRIRVEWSADPGAGRAEPRDSFSDADGIAETTWTLGSAPGSQKLRAHLRSAHEVAFDATGTR